MFRAKAVVVKLVEDGARSCARWRPELSEGVRFVAQFEGSNSVLVCTLQDRLQAELVVPGRGVLLSVVGVREDCCSLLVDVEEGPRGHAAALPAAIAEVNKYMAAATRLPKKRQFFEEAR